VIEAVGEGHDTIYSSVNYALLAGSEIELLSAIDNSAVTAMNLTGNDLANEIWGTAGANVLTGNGGDDALIGFGGDDTLLGGDGTDYLDGGTGNDGLAGGTGNDFMVGGDGNDVLDGGTGADGMYGGIGNDVYFFDNAGDYAIEAAGEGHDTIFTSVSYALDTGSEIEILSAVDNSSASAMDLTGNELANELWGTNGVNILTGGAGNDALIGFGGNDTLAGGDGNDYLDGGAGQDNFVFDTALGAGNVDIVAGFVSGTDKFVLDDAIFSGLGLGSLPASVFHVGPVATDEDQRIIYDQASGSLYYDADGSGGGAAILFASVSPGTTIIASDFIVS
jgi:Ca2+-binding RTX toxin-like protein